MPRKVILFCPVIRKLYDLLQEKRAVHNLFLRGADYLQTTVVIWPELTVAGDGWQFRFPDAPCAVSVYCPGVTTKVAFVFPFIGLLLILTLAPVGSDVTLSRPGGLPV